MSTIIRRIHVVSAMATLACSCMAAETTPPPQRQADPGWAAAAAAYQIVSPGKMAGQPDRIGDIMSASSLLEAKVRTVVAGLPKADGWGGKDAEFRPKVLGSALAFIPIAIASADDGSSPIELVMASAEQETMRSVASTMAYHVAMTDTVARIIPPFMPGLDGIPNAPLSIITEVGTGLRDAITGEIAKRQLMVQASNVSDTALALAGVAKPVAEGLVAREVVWLRVSPRMDDTALASPDAVKRAKDAVRARIPQVVEAPYTPARIDAWCQQITAEGKQVIAGQDMPRKEGKAKEGQPGAAKPKSIELVSIQIEAGPAVGTITSKRQGRQVVIPPGSHGDAHLLTGVSAEIGGGGKQGTPIMLNLVHSFRGPNGSMVPLPNLRMMGQAQALDSAGRIGITINSMSYVFPNGRYKQLGGSGMVIDSKLGIEGVPGDYNWRITELVPWTMLSSGAKGFADALQSNSQVTVVGNTSTTIAQTGDKIENALWSGAGEAAGVFADKLKSITDTIKPTIDVRNGKLVTVVLTQPVIIDASDEEWNGVLDVDALADQ